MSGSPHVVVQNNMFLLPVQNIGKTNFLAVSFLAVFLIIVDSQLLKNSRILFVVVYMGV